MEYSSKNSQTVSFEQQLCVSDNSALLPGILCAYI